MLGDHNASNAMAAFIIAISLDIESEIIIKALKTFPGIKRRFSIELKKPKIFIDDYAHRGFVCVIFTRFRLRLRFCRNLNINFLFKRRVELLRIPLSSTLSLPCLICIPSSPSNHGKIPFL